MLTHQRNEKPQVRQQDKINGIALLALKDNKYPPLVAFDTLSIQHVACVNEV